MVRLAELFMYESIVSDDNVSEYSTLNRVGDITVVLVLH